jgi:hypothetical protein
MKCDFENYEAICDEELAAADRATCENARVAHLERALRNALLAVHARRDNEPVDLTLWRRGRAMKNANGKSTPAA